MTHKLKWGFTLMEILIVVALITIIAIIVLIAINPWQQIGKSFDSRRKGDLNTLGKVLEDYYNDKGCYPPPSSICYDTATNITIGTGSTQVIGQQCHICGNESASPSFSPYLTKLPCDPQHPVKNYVYNYDCPGAVCPICIPAFRVYSNLTSVYDQDNTKLNCQMGGCGPRPVYGYDYGISSSNTTLEVSNQYNCISNGKCNVCISYLNCLNNSPGCTDKTKIYGSRVQCCNNNPPSACN